MVPIYQRGWKEIWILGCSTSSLEFLVLSSSLISLFFCNLSVHLETIHCTSWKNSGFMLVLDLKEIQAVCLHFQVWTESSNQNRLRKAIFFDSIRTRMFIKQLELWTKEVQRCMGKDHKFLLLSELHPYEIHSSLVSPLTTAQQYPISIYRAVCTNGILHLYHFRIISWSSEVVSMYPKVQCSYFISLVEFEMSPHFFRFLLLPHQPPTSTSCISR